MGSRFGEASDEFFQVAKPVSLSVTRRRLLGSLLILFLEKWMIWRILDDLEDFWMIWKNGIFRLFSSFTPAKWMTLDHSSSEKPASYAESYGEVGQGPPSIP